MLIVLFVFLLLFPVIYSLSMIDKIKSKGKIHLFGIYGYFGLPGAGKTMCMCRYLNKMRKKYKDKIYIMTNFHYAYEDFEFKTWKQLLKDYDKPLIVAWDEIQNEFNSRDFKNFPISLMTELTQVRKGNGIQILYTAQRWHFVDKNFRSLSFGAWECKTWLGRYTFCRRFTPEDYEDMTSQVSVDKKMKVKSCGTNIFIQTERLRNSYDSYKKLQSAKSKEYMSREEINAIEKIV